MYDYQTEKKELFTDEGQRTFIKIRDNVNYLLKQSGAVRMQEAISVATGSSWTMLACVDRMVELGELVEIKYSDTVAGQCRIFVSAHYN